MQPEEYTQVAQVVEAELGDHFRIMNVLDRRQQGDEWVLNENAPLTGILVVQDMKVAKEDDEASYSTWRFSLSPERTKKLYKCLKSGVNRSYAMYFVYETISRTPEPVRQ